jgi:hypothetical protein
MVAWNLKNELCYNSRLSKFEFECVVTDYCKGIPASTSSLEFKQVMGATISRQTIAFYYFEISRAIANYQKLYPWFSVELPELTSEQLSVIREVVYAKNGVIARLRDAIEEIHGQRVSVDSHTYISVLRDMSKRMNGLPRKTFAGYLVRACELALQIEAGTDDPINAMADRVLSLFENDPTLLFRRKESPKTRAAWEEYLRFRKEDSEAWYHRYWNPKDFEPSDEKKEYRKWFASLSDQEKEKLKDREFLRGFYGGIELSQGIESRKKPLDQ